MPSWILRADDPVFSDEVMKRATERFQIVGEARSCEASKDPELTGFGTTMTLAASVGRHLFLANIGDSRADLLHHGKLFQLTHDHTLGFQ